VIDELGEEGVELALGRTGGDLGTNGLLERHHAHQLQQVSYYILGGTPCSCAPGFRHKRPPERRHVAPSVSSLAGSIPLAVVS
jgi:hypothetical protein